jgi:hypothetical protein
MEHGRGKIVDDLAMQAMGWWGVGSYSTRCIMAEDSIASASALELDTIALFYYLYIVVFWIPHGG